jgi:hypothetical protein
MALRSVWVESVTEGDATFLHVRLAFEAKVGGIQCRPSLVLLKKKRIRTIFRTVYPQYVAVDTPRALTFTVRLSSDELSDGDYSMTVAMAVLQADAVHAIKAEQAVSLRIRRGAELDAGAAGAEPPLLAVTLPWEVEMLHVERA